jgi:hemerythrin-like metal-binding protein
LLSPAQPSPCLPSGPALRRRQLGCGRVSFSFHGLGRRCKRSRSSHNDAPQGGMMEHIVWSDDFSVGVDEMDYQHKRLVGMINRLIDLTSLTRTDQSVIQAAYLKVLSDMVQYAAVHFDTEERYLKAIGYSDFDNHIEEHKSFSKTANDLEQKAAEGDLDIAGTSQFLQKWLSGHILHSDMDYRKFKECSA